MAPPAAQGPDVPAEPAPESFGPSLLLVKKLAAGGMAEVFRAKLLGAGGFERTVAVKRILPHFAQDTEFKRMFQAEANLCAKLRHPNIVPVYSNGEHAGYLYLVMELVDGKNLAEVNRALRERGQRMPVEMACFIVSEAAKGLDHAHRYADESTGQPLGIIHRDVSPQNVMLSYSGHVQVVDFGIAKAADRAEMSEAGVLKGKLAYMAPEQIEGTGVDLRTDVFALGVVLHELLTGRRLFKSEHRAETMKRVLDCVVEPPSAVNAQVAPELDRIALRALAREKADRYPSALELYRELTTHLHTTYPRFLPTDLADFLQRLLADVMRSETEDVRHRSADLPTTITPREDSGGRGGATPPPVQGDRTGSAGRPGTSPFRPRLFAPEERRPWPRWGWALLAAAALVAAVLLLGRGRVAPQQPSALPGLVAWFRADEILQGDGERVARWPNRGLPAAEAVQAEEGRQPRLRKNAQNGLPAVVFAGNGEYLVADEVARKLRGAVGLTVIYASLISSDRDQYVWALQHEGDPNGDLCRAGYSKGDHLRVRTNQEEGGFYLDSERTAAFYGLMVYSVVLDSREVSVFLNGEREMHSPLRNPVNFAGAGRFSLGQEWDREGPSDFLDGAVFELALYARALEERERRAVEEYLLAKYAVARR